MHGGQFALQCTLCRIFREVAFQPRMAATAEEQLASSTKRTQRRGAYYSNPHASDEYHVVERILGICGTWLVALYSIPKKFHRRRSKQYQWPIKHLLNKIL
jgi:hypothetical protein